MTIRTLALAAALFAVPGSAFAANSAVELKYDDLDLSTAKGQAELNKRVDDAARQACGSSAVRTGTILRSKAENQCYAETREKLRQRVASLTGQQQRG